jgi:hypothetical protein
VGQKIHSASAGRTERENAPKIDRLGQVEGVPDKKALAALKEAKRKLDELTRRPEAKGV